MAAAKRTDHLSTDLFGWQAEARPRKEARKQRKPKRGRGKGHSKSARPRKAGMSVHSETDTVIKRILPYLRRRGYDIEADIDFEAPTKRLERYTKGYIDLLVTCGKSKPSFLIEAKRSTRTLTDGDARQAVEYGAAQKVPFVVLTNGQDIRAYNVRPAGLFSGTAG